MEGSYTMPNWCDNQVEIYCTCPEEREAVVEFLRGTIKESVIIEGEVHEQVVGLPVCFNSIVPLPDGEWDYDWCLENWGCKWEPNVTGWNATEDEIFFTLMTPWSPPEGICFAIREKFPNIVVNWFYREDGLQIAGWL